MGGVVRWRLGETEWVWMEACMGRWWSEIGGNMVNESRRRRGTGYSCGAMV